MRKSVSTVAPSANHTTSGMSDQLNWDGARSEKGCANMVHLLGQRRVERGRSRRSGPRGALSTCSPRTAPGPACEVSCRGRASKYPGSGSDYTEPAPQGELTFTGVVPPLPRLRGIRLHFCDIIERR